MRKFFLMMQEIETSEYFSFDRVSIVLSTLCAGDLSSEQPADHCV